MDISSALTAQMESTIALMKSDVLSSISSEIEQVAIEVAETGDVACILELSPMALAMFASDNK